VGGRYATVSVEELFAAASNIDIIARGDGEEIIWDIASGLPLREITGISYREGGRIIHNKTRDLSSLNDAVYPNRKMRRVNYRLLYKNIDLGLNMDFISTSRGCPYNCRFCTFTNNPLGQKRSWNGRSARSVVEELKTIDAEFIFVVDDNFAADMNRVEEICNLIIAEGIKKTFVVALRLEIYKYPQILKKMFQVKTMQKGFDVALAERAFSEIRKINFYNHGYFIVGCIGESEPEMLEIAPFAKRLKLDTINLSLLRTEKYSPLNELIAKSRGYYVGEDNIICSEEYPLERLRSIRHRISRSYYNFPVMLRITKKIFTAHIIRFRYLVKLIVIFFLRGKFKQREKEVLNL